MWLLWLPLSTHKYKKGYPKESKRVPREEKSTSSKFPARDNRFTDTCQSPISVRSRRFWNGRARANYTGRF
jgi:hypothetical protein